MVFNSSTSTDYLDLLSQLITTVTSRHLDAIAINAAGTGYVAGDILGITATGSTSTLVAKIEVLTVGGGGNITAARVYRGGAYTVDPSTTTGNAATGGTGTGATFNLTMAAGGWTKVRRSQVAVSAVVSAGGSGYSVGNQLTLVTGGGINGDGGSSAIFQVATTGGGGSVATVTLVQAGNYEKTPGNPAATTGGAGTGATLTVTYADASTVDQIVILEGTGLSGSDTIFVGIKTFNGTVSLNHYYNWMLLGFTGFTSSLSFGQQPGISPGLSNVDAIVDQVGAVVPLKTSDAHNMTWWINHNGRRIILVVKVTDGTTTNYMQAYLGLLNQFGTSTEYPYPLMVAGPTNNIQQLYNENTVLIGGLTEVISHTASNPAGTMLVRRPGGTWKAYAAEDTTGSSNRSIENAFGVYPIGGFTLPSPTEDNATSSLGLTWASFIPQSGVPGTLSIILKPTPGSSTTIYWLVAPFVYETDSATGYPAGWNVLGELDSVFFFMVGQTGVVSEDRFSVSTDRYTVFKNGNRSQDWSFMALKEN